MALLELDKDAELERQQQLEDREFHANIEQMRLVQDKALAELKIVQQGRVKIRARKLESRERIAVGLIKLIPLMLLSLLLPIVLLCGREVPKFLQEFMTL